MSSEPCTPGQPEVGTLIMEGFTCGDQRVPQGEGRLNSDFYVANHWWRAVFRHPQDALTIAHVGGFTLLDLATWDGRDRLHEAAPLIDGGWLDVDDWRMDGDGIWVEGTIVSLPDAVAPGAGEPARVRWSFDSERPHIVVEGATGLYVHPRGDARRIDAAFYLPDMTLRMDSTHIEDLGGAVRIDGTTLIPDIPEASWSWGATTPLTGSNNGDAIELQQDGRIVARIPATGTLDLVVPPHDAVRAVAADAIPGPWVESSQEVDLQVGLRGAISVDSHDQRSVAVSWRSEDGRSGATTLSPGGGRLPLGAGIYTLTFPKDPRRVEWSTQVSVEPDAVVPIDVPRRELDSSTTWATVGIGLPSDRSRTWRGSEFRAVVDAQSQGFDAVAFLVDDDTTDVDPEAAGVSSLRAHNGLRRSGTGWVVEAWPVQLTEKKNAHGSLGAPTDDPLVALGSAGGGLDVQRHLRVDVSTLAALGTPDGVQQAPDLVRLDAPASDLNNWEPWLAWIDAGRGPGATGPVTWVPVPDTEALTLADIDQPLFAGNSVAGNGPRLTVKVNGRGLRVQTGAAPLDVVELWTDQGLWTTLSASRTTATRPNARWILPVGRSSEHWAVGPPLWLVDVATGAPLSAGDGRPALR